MSTDVQTIYTSTAGLNLTRFFSCISAAFSMLGIFLVYSKSKMKLNLERRSIMPRTIYHRIVLMTSLGHLIASLAMSLTTVPMPKDMIYTQFEGTVVGNTATCSAQGLFVSVGRTMVSIHILHLFVYYVCSIKYRMSDERFSKRLEPLLHATNAFICSVSGIINVQMGLLNPTPYNRSVIWIVILIGVRKLTMTV